MSGVGCYVLDVGQGNATLIEGVSGAALVDAGPGKLTTLTFLKDHGINRLEAVFISHADKDHLGGLLSLLAKASSDAMFEIGHVYVNPDARDSDVWGDVCYVLDDMEQRKVTTYSPQLGPDTFHQPLDLGGCAISVLGPSKYMRLRAVGGKHVNGRRQDANSLSAVIHVACNDAGWVLLPGDLDYLGFTDAMSHNVWERAPVMVYPHHGGRAGTDIQTQTLARDIVTASASRTVVFSGRSQTTNFPSALVVDTLLELTEKPTLLSIGQSPVLAERITQLVNCSHRNGTGTLHVLPPDGGGEVAIADYVRPDPPAEQQ